MNIKIVDKIVLNKSWFTKQYGKVDVIGIDEKGKLYLRRHNQGYRKMCT